MSQKEIYFWMESDTESIFGFPYKNGGMKRIFSSMKEATDAFRDYSHQFNTDPSRFTLYGGGFESIETGDQLIEN